MILGSNCQTVDSNLILASSEYTYASLVSQEILERLYISLTYAMKLMDHDFDKFGPNITLEHNHCRNRVVSRNKYMQS